MPALPTTAFDKTKASFSRKSFANFTPTGGTLTTIVGKICDIDAKLTVVPLKQPDAIGVNRTVRNAQSEAEENVTMTDLENIDDIITVLGSFTGMKTGVVQFFVVDPSDATGKVRYLSDEFPCSVIREGNIKFGGGDWAKTSLKFMSEKLGAITWSPNATVT